MAVHPNRSQAMTGGTNVAAIPSLQFIDDSARALQSGACWASSTVAGNLQGIGNCASLTAGSPTDHPSPCRPGKPHVENKPCRRRPRRAPATAPMSCARALVIVNSRRILVDADMVAVSALETIRWTASLAAPSRVTRFAIC